jgi:hypothetical protein
VAPPDEAPLAGAIDSPRGSAGAHHCGLTVVDMNTIKIVAPALTAGKYSIILTDSDGEAASLNASFTAN